MGEDLEHLIEPLRGAPDEAMRYFIFPSFEELGCHCLESLFVDDKYRDIMTNGVTVRLAGWDRAHLSISDSMYYSQVMGQRGIFMDSFEVSRRVEALREAPLRSHDDLSIVVSCGERKKSISFSESDYFLDLAVRLRESAYLGCIRFYSDDAVLLAHNSRVTDFFTGRGPHHLRYEIVGKEIKVYHAREEDKLDFIYPESILKSRVITKDSDLRLGLVDLERSDRGRKYGYRSLVYNIHEIRENEIYAFDEFASFFQSQRM